MTNDDIAQRVAEYYPHIDDCDFDWVVALFAPDAVYDRAEQSYVGRPAIDHFFRAERKIRGRHLVDGLSVDRERRTVTATGRFEGHGEAGDARSVGFADLWRFDAAGLVARRQTYLAMGHAYVQR